MVSDLKTFTNKGYKSAGQKKSWFLGKLCLTEQDFFGIAVSQSVSPVFLPPLPKVQCPNFLDFSILGEKKRKEVVSDFNFFAHKCVKSL